MEELKKNNRRSGLWRNLAVIIFVLALFFTYLVHLGQIYSSDFLLGLDSNTENYKLEMVDWESKIEFLKDNRDSVKEEYLQCIEEKDKKKDKVNKELSDCQEEITEVKAQIIKYKGLIDDLIIERDNLKADIKACP